MKTMNIILQNLWICEDGAIASEYVILISLIGVVALTGVTILGGVVQKLFQDAADMFPR